MNDARYSVFYKAFAAHANVQLAAVAELIKNRFGRELTEIRELDFDTEKGFGFGVEGEPELFVELILTDGEERGFDGVGLRLTCSPGLNGFIFDYVPEPGPSLEQLNFKLSELSASTQNKSSIAETIQQKWIDIEVDTARLFVGEVFK